MASPGILTEWEFDGTIGLAFSLLTVLVGIAYLTATEVGRRRDRRGRRWPSMRTTCFLGGIALLLVALDSRLGAEADVHLTAHMVEHMLIWLAVAPLLVAGAPVRLAFFALGRPGRQRLSAVLHSKPLVTLTKPLLAAGLFAAVVVITQIPAVYDLTLEDDLVHLAEHALYLMTAVLAWAPVIAADPLPHRTAPSDRCLCIVACMVPMAAVSVWLLVAGAPLYIPYRDALGPSAALGDQRLAGLVMLVAAFPAIAIALGVPRPSREVGRGWWPPTDSTAK